MELKTLKEIEAFTYDENDDPYVHVNELKDEAIKWINNMQRQIQENPRLDLYHDCGILIDWIIDFFNLDEMEFYDGDMNLREI